MDEIIVEASCDFVERILKKSDDNKCKVKFLDKLGKINKLSATCKNDEEEKKFLNEINDMIIQGKEDRSQMATSGVYRWYRRGYGGYVDNT